MNQEFGPVRGLPFEREYTLTTGTKIFLYIFITVMLAGSAGLIYESVNDKSWWVVLIGILLIILCVYIFVELKATKITISQNGIKRAGYFSSRELLMYEIKGYEFLNGKKLMILPIDKSKKKINLGDYIFFNHYHEIRAWLTMYCTDLDAEQHQIEIAEVQTNNSFGYTTEERLAELKRLKQFCSYFNYAGGALCLWLFAYPKPYNYVILTGLIWPWVVMFVFYLKRDAVTFNRTDKKKETVFPSLSIALIMPPVALVIRAFTDFKLVHFTDTLLPALLVTAVSGTAFVRVVLGAQQTTRFNQTTWLNGAVFVLLYSFTTPVIINCNFDHSEPKVYTAQVLAHRLSTDKCTTYNLTLSKWGPAESEEVEVNKSLYNEVRIGDTVQVNLKPGLLKMRWFYVSR